MFRYLTRSALWRAPLLTRPSLWRVARQVREGLEECIHASLLGGIRAIDTASVRPALTSAQILNFEPSTPTPAP